MDNITGSMCYFITGINIILRLSYIIWNEINNLTDINVCFEKIHLNECLTKEEQQQYNKYLLIQTLIEVQQFSDKKIDFIVSRLSQFVFSIDDFNISDIIITNIYNNIVYINSYIKIIYSIIELTDYETIFNIDTIMNNINIITNYIISYYYTLDNVKYEDKYNLNKDLCIGINKDILNNIYINYTDIINKYNNENISQIPLESTDIILKIWKK